MIVHAAGLADFPADRHALEDVVFENEIARVVAIGEEAIFVESFGAHGMEKDVVLNVLQREITLGNGGETFYPVRDGQSSRGHLFLHGAPPKGNPEIRGIAKEL